MKHVRIGAAVVNQTPLDWNGNRDRIIGAIEAARSDGVRVLCFPEMSIPGYGCEDAFHSASLLELSLDVLEEILPHTRGMIVGVGIPVLYKHALFNSVAMVADGKILGFVTKRFLAGDGLYYEPRWFKPWKEGVRSEIEIRGKDYPIGDLYFDVGGLRIGMEICEEAWVASRPGGGLAAQAMDVILNASASHFAFGKSAVRRRFVLEGSRSFGVTYVYTNLVGNDAGRMIFDGGVLIASQGELIASGPRFGYAPYSVTWATVDVDTTRMTQARHGFQPDFENDENCVEADFSFSPLDAEASLAGSTVESATIPAPPADARAWESAPELEFEEFTRAIALGLFDYLRKSRSHGFVVSASGGADSSAVATLVGQMVSFALHELGESDVRERLSYIDLPEIDSSATAAAAFVHRLLTCVYQSTRNSSDTTREAARTVSEALGAAFHELDVDDLVESYRSKIEGAIGRELTWETDDVTLQNIQARVRAPSVWMFANLQNALLLATSNRSEAAVGYATMDGDTSGGLSPIAGIDKDFLRRWLRWMETTGPVGLGPIPELRVVNEQQPTAELRPPSASQTDEADLMPYDLLDAIEDLAIGQKKSPVEVFLKLRPRFPQYATTQFGVWVERFYRLWCRNQWKRERYAPSFHVDDKNLDPKTWCRFPILSGGFDRELEELRRVVDRIAGQS